MKMVKSFQGEVWENVLAESSRLAMAGQHHHNVVLPAQVPGVFDGVPGVSDENCHSFATCSTNPSTVQSAPVRLYLSMHNIAEQARMCSALLTDMDGKAPQPFHCQLSYAQSCTLHHNPVAAPVRRICWVPQSVHFRAPRSHCNNLEVISRSLAFQMTRCTSSPCHTW